MGMGYAANCADVVEESFVKEQCPKEFEQFIQSLADREDITIEDVAQNAQYENEDSAVYRNYQSLCSQFEQKTGLSLYLGYHDRENTGDRYDDVEGVFWCVEGVFHFTPAGEKFKQHISRKYWVSFG